MSGGGRLRAVHQIATTAIVATVLVQALIAGQHLFGDWGIGLHATLGNAVFAVAVLAAGLAVAKQWSRSLIVTGVILAALLAIQILLGNASTGERSTAAAIHIPLGLVAFGVASYQLLLSRPALLGPTGNRT